MGFLKKLILLGILIVGGLWFYGRSLPREHSISSSIILVAPLDTVYKVMRGFGSSPLWWTDVKAVRPLTGKKYESWEQNMGPDGLVQIEVLSVTPGRKIVTRVLNDEQQSWGGTVTYDIFTGAAGTEVVVTEEGWVDPPLRRVLLKLRGRYRTVDSYLSSLGAHFGEPVTARHGR